MIETSTIIEAIHYLLKKIGPSQKIQLVKLIYLADKYHLIHYGRTITNDEYFAMPHGPVGSTVQDVLSFDTFTLSPKEYKYAQELFKTANKQHTLEASSAKVKFEMLSDTDIEALDFVIKKFGGMNSWDLKRYTHKYPEWRQYESLFKGNRTKREKINTKELLSLIKNDPLALPKTHIKESENILTGNYQ